MPFHCVISSLRKAYQDSHHSDTMEPLTPVAALSSPQETKTNAHVLVRPVKEPVNSSKLNGMAEARNCANEYTALDRPLGYIKPVRIITIGAGASGINMAYQVKNYLRKVELVVYDKNPAIGGTWYENRYPGCKCDIRESHRLTNVQRTSD